MADWHPIETAPDDKKITVGTPYGKYWVSATSVGKPSPDSGFTHWKLLEDKENGN